MDGYAQHTDIDDLFLLIEQEEEDFEEEEPLEHTVEHTVDCEVMSIDEGVLADCDSIVENDEATDKFTTTIGDQGIGYLEPDDETLYQVQYFRVVIFILPY